MMIEHTDDRATGLDDQPSTPEVSLLRNRCPSSDSFQETEDGEFLRQRTPSFSEPVVFPMWAEDSNNFPSQLRQESSACDGGTGGTCTEDSGNLPSQLRQEREEGEGGTGTDGTDCKALGNDTAEVMSEGTVSQLSPTGSATLPKFDLPLLMQTESPGFRGSPVKILQQCIKSKHKPPTRAQPRLYDDILEDLPPQKPRSSCGSRGAYPFPPHTSSPLRTKSASFCVSQSIDTFGWPSASLHDLGERLSSWWSSQKADRFRFDCSCQEEDGRPNTEELLADH